MNSSIVNSHRCRRRRVHIIKFDVHLKLVFPLHRVLISLDTCNHDTVSHNFCMNNQLVNNIHRHTTTATLYIGLASLFLYLSWCERWHDNLYVSNSKKTIVIYVRQYCLSFHHSFVYLLMSLPGKVFARKGSYYHFHPLVTVRHIQF